MLKCIFKVTQFFFYNILGYKLYSQPGHVPQWVQSLGVESYLSTALL